MTDPWTPTDAPDADLPAPEEDALPLEGQDETGIGAWMDERPPEPVDEPAPERDA